MGLIGILFRKRKISIPMMLTAVILSTFEVAEPFWMRLTDYTRYVKLAGCVFLFVGGICKIATWAAKRYRFGSEFDRKQRKKAIRKGNDRRDKTLIPQRITKYGYMERR